MQRIARITGLFLIVAVALVLINTYVVDVINSIPSLCDYKRFEDHIPLRQSYDYVELTRVAQEAGIAAQNFGNRMTIHLRDQGAEYTIFLQSESKESNKTQIGNRSRD